MPKAAGGWRMTASNGWSSVGRNNYRNTFSAKGRGLPLSWEIDENLCRADLTDLRRAQHTARRAEIVREKAQFTKLSEVSSDNSKRGPKGYGSIGWHQVCDAQLLVLGAWRLGLNHGLELRNCETELARRTGRQQFVQLGR